MRPSFLRGPLLSLVLVVSAARAESGSDWKIVQAGDFDGGGLGDALWNDPVTNRMAIWRLRGQALVEPGQAIPGPPGEDWSVVNAADFNADGMYDVTWSSPKTRAYSVYLMRGACLLEAGPVLPVPGGEGWAAVTSGDSNGDGCADMVFHNAATNRFRVALMHGTRPFEVGPELPGPPGDGWSLVTEGDFNLDGLQDVLWYNTVTQGIAVSLLQGTELLETGPEIPGPPGEGWTATNTADFNLDGTADVLWSNSRTGEAAVWLMDGTELLEAGPEIPGPPGEGWTAPTGADADGDGLSDIFWFTDQPRARMAIWTMRGAHLQAPGIEIPGPD